MPPPSGVLGPRCASSRIHFEEERCMKCEPQNRTRVFHVEHSGLAVPLTFVLTGLNISIIGTELTQDHVPHRALRSIPRRKTRASGRVLRPSEFLPPLGFKLFTWKQTRF